MTAEVSWRICEKICRRLLAPRNRGPCCGPRPAIAAAFAARTFEERSDHGSGQATGPHATDGGRNLQLQRTRLPGGGDLPLRDGHPGEERLSRGARYCCYPHRLGGHLRFWQAGYCLHHRYRLHSPRVAEARGRLSRALGGRRTRTR